MSGSSSSGFVERIFGIDVRTLAAFRIGLGLLLLNDLRVRASDITAFYTDAGVLPRAAFLELYNSSMPNLSSLHLLSGLFGYQLLLFLFAAACAFCVLIGYRTRVFTFVSWVLLVSIQNRNPMIVHGGDVILRMLVFWAFFLPLGAVWSCDRMLSHAASNSESTDQETSRPFLSVGSTAILLQMCFVYWFAVALKTGAEWRGQGTALFYALSIDQLVTPIGRALLPHRGLLTFLTHLTMFLERFGPLLILLPWWRIRTVMVGVLIGFHVSMGLCLTLGSFPYVMTLGWCLFLPSEFWQMLGRFYASRPERGWKAQLEVVRQRFEAFQQKISAAYGGSRPVSLLQTVAPRWDNLCKRIWADGLQIVAGACLLYIFLWNCRTTDFNTYQKYFPVTYNWLGEAGRFDQSWGMFAPRPLVDDGWYVIPAMLANGKTVDLFRDGASLDWAKPKNLSALFPNERWQKYSLNLWLRSNSPHRGYYAGYLKRQWEANHPASERIVGLEIDYMEEDTDPNNNDVKPKKVVLWSQKYN